MRSRSRLAVLALAFAVMLSSLPGSARPGQDRRRTAGTQAPKKDPRQNPRFRGTQPAVQAQAAPLSPYGLVDPASSAELGSSLAKAAYVPAASVRRRLEEFNVLTRAFVDPQTGEVVLLGEYDPRFATGPIAYRDLLADALRNPYPAFSLANAANDGGNQQIVKALDADLSRVARDPQFGAQWMERLIKPVLDTPGESLERKLLEWRLKEGFRISAADYAVHRNWLNRKTDTFASEAEYRTVRSVVSEIMSKAGVPLLVGQGFIAIKWMFANPSPETAGQAYALLGNLSGYSDIRDRRNRNEITRDEATILLAAAAYEPILRAIKVPESEIRRLIDGLKAGRVTQETVLARINTTWDGLGVKALAENVFHGFRFSNAYLSRMYSVPAVTSGVELYGNPPDSPLARVLFEADYTLKYITSAAPSGDAVPTGSTFHELLADLSSSAGRAGKLPSSGVNRYWIGPGRVEMEDLGRASGVRFKSASVRVLAEPLDSQGGDVAGDDFYRAALDTYARRVTRAYDNYAREYPALHTLREAEKVVALARWIKAKNVAIPLAGARPATKPVPDRVEGFWGLTYLVNPAGDSDTIVLWMQGGVTFDQKEGEGWIDVKPVGPQGEIDTLHALAASTALAEKASAAALGGELEAARDLAEKSALAMTGKIDISALPAPVPVPSEAGLDKQPSAAAQAAVSTAAIEAVESNAAALARASADLAAAAPLEASDPAAYERAAALSRAAEQKSRENLDRLNKLLVSYRSAPLRLPDAAAMIAALRPAGSGAGAVAGAAPGDAPAVAAARPETPAVMDWPARLHRWKQELEQTEAKIRTTREALLRLNAAIQVDRRLYEQWERDGDEAFDRLVGTAADVAIDYGIGALFGRSKKIRELAEKLPGKPADVIEKYRHLAAQAERLQQAKAVGDLDDLASRENKSWPEIFETYRDGLGQLAGWFELDDTVPGKAWKYGSLTVDLAYDLTELRLGWTAVKGLEQNTEAQREAVRKLAEMMRQLVETKKELRAKIDAER